jgi:hypothetical protein
MLDISFAPALVVAVPAARLLVVCLACSSSGRAGWPSQNQAFVGMLAAVTPTAYAWSFSTDIALLAAATMNATSALCLYFAARACKTRRPQERPRLGKTEVASNCSRGSSDHV